MAIAMESATKLQSTSMQVLDRELRVFHNQYKVCKASLTLIRQGSFLDAEVITRLLLVGLGRLNVIIAGK